jgi:carboxypeptidase C (cathepsin A)
MYLLTHVSDVCLLLCYCLCIAESRSSNLEDILLTPNPHTWSKAAHVLYVDSPAGTGLSYTEGAASYTTNDTATIEDLYAFMVGWLEQYPEFKGRPLYLAGEGLGQERRVHIELG